MRTIENRLFDIEIKIKKLIEENTILIKENTRLKNEKSQQAQDPSINNNNDEPSDQRNLEDIKNKINQYALEIEECIDIVKSLN